MRIQMLKRDIRLFLHCLLPAAALTVVFAAVCAAAAFTAVKGAEDVYTPVRAAVVDEEDSIYSRLVVRALSKSDYLSGLLEISRCGMEEGMDGLAAGDLAAVIVLPDGIVEGVTTGARMKGTIYLSPAAAAHADIAAEVAAFGELLLAAGQYGVFSGERLIREYGLGSDFHSRFLAESNARLLQEGFGANSAWFDVVVTDYGGTGMSTAAYYAASWSALLLLLSVLFFSRLYTEDLTRPILCRLRAMGIGDGAFLLGKLFCPALFHALLLAVILAASKPFAPAALSAPAIGCALLGLLLSAGFGLLLMVNHRGTVIVAACALIGAFLCGGIVPRQMLPDFLLKAGSFTPYGAVQSLLRPLFGGTLAPSALICAPLYLTLLLLLACRRLRQLRLGGEVT